MSSSSLANWDGGTTRNSAQSSNSDVRTLGFPTETNNHDRTTAYLDASWPTMEDHTTVWWTGDSREGCNLDDSSMAAVQPPTPTVSHLVTDEATAIDGSNTAVEEHVPTRTGYPGSVYSADADGEPDDGQGKAFSDLLSPLQSPIDERQAGPNTTLSNIPAEATKIQHQDLNYHIPTSPEPPYSSSPLFTPPSSDQSTPLPPLTPFPSPPSRKRVFLSHVDVPPLLAGRNRSDYIRITRKKRVRPVEVRMTLGEALQVSMEHNAQLGAVHTTKQEKTGPRQAEKKRPQRNAAGPSSVSSASLSKNIKIYTKRNRDESLVVDFPRKKTKIHQVTERLHVAEADLPSERIGRPPYTKYDAEQGSLRMFIGIIPPLSVAVLTLNTRFAVEATRVKEIDKEKENIAQSTKNAGANKHGSRSSWFVWPPLRSSFLDAARGEYYAGAPVKHEHDVWNNKAERELPSTYPGTKRRRVISSDPAPEDALHIRRKEKQTAELPKRPIRVVEPMNKDTHAPRLRHHSRPTSEQHNICNDTLLSPSLSQRPRPSYPTAVQEASSARFHDSHNDTAARKSSHKIVYNTAPERHEGIIISSDYHRIAEVAETPLEGPEGEQEEVFLPSDSSRPWSPSDGLSDAIPSGRHEPGQRAMASSSYHRGHSSTGISQEPLWGSYENGQWMASPSGGRRLRRLSSTTSVVEETSASEQDTASPVASPSPSYQPSAKSLGKQRAVSPVLDARFGPDVLLPPSLQFTEDHDISTTQASPYTATLHNGLSLRTNFFLPSDHLTDAPFMPQVPISEAEGFLVGPLDSPLKPYGLDQPQNGHDDAFLQQSSITARLAGIPTSPEYDEAMMNPWSVDSGGSSLSNVPPSQYGDGTINPSLLGMQDMDVVQFNQPRSPSPPYLGACSPWDTVSHSRRFRSRDPNSPSRSPNPSLSSLSSSEDSDSPRSRLSHKREPSTSSEYVQNKTSASPSLRPSRPVRHSLRQMPKDMISTLELDSAYGSSDDDSQPIAARKKSAIVKKVGSPRKQLLNDVDDFDSRVKRKSSKRSEWPLCEERENCHQCRGSTYIVKLKCPCGKRYCVRCLSTRYEGEFIYNPARLTFTCPHCQKTCTCDICTRKRGEVYVGLRPRAEYERQPSQSPLPMISADRTRSKPSQRPETLTSPAPHARPRSSLGGKTNLPPFSTTVKGPETYWATMYAVSGEKIGKAFVGENGKDDVVVFRPLYGGKHVFVGALQPSWGLGPRPVLKDLDPVPEQKMNSLHQRHYIGDKATLRYRDIRNFTNPTTPTRAEFGKAEDMWGSHPDFSSPLSSLGDPRNGGEGECRQWASFNESDLGMALQEGIELFLAKGPGIDFSPDSLKDTDVARAITLGLMACGHGIQVQLEA